MAIRKLVFGGIGFKFPSASILANLANGCALSTAGSGPACGGKSIHRVYIMVHCIYICFSALFAESCFFSDSSLPWANGGALSRRLRGRRLKGPLRQGHFSHYTLGPRFLLMNSDVFEVSSCIAANLATGFGLLRSQRRCWNGAVGGGTSFLLNGLAMRAVRLRTPDSWSNWPRWQLAC